MKHVLRNPPSYWGEYDFTEEEVRARKEEENEEEGEDEEALLRDLYGEDEYYISDQMQGEGPF